MKKFLWAMILMAGCVRAQVAVPRTSDGGQQPAVDAHDPSSANRLGGKVGLVRGVLKQVDPIHDKLLIHAFGGRDLPIAFDPRTKFFSENSGKRLTNIPAGSVVSVDTVINGSKLFAIAVRASSSNTAELKGQVVRYDAAKSQLTFRDPVSPESISLRITPSTTVVNRDQPASLQVLSPGTLVRASWSPARNEVKNIEILAERGGSFTFQGRIISVDLRSRALALLNDSDQSVRELSIGSLDAGSLRLLREGADISIQAEFDGDRYNVRTVALVSRNP